jgi:hypothetical protein
MQPSTVVSDAAVIETLVLLVALELLATLCIGVVVSTPRHAVMTAMV